MVPDPIGDIIPTLQYYKDTEVFHEDIIDHILHTHPLYDEDNAIVLKVLLYFFQGSNHMIYVKTLISKRNGHWDILNVKKNDMGISEWDTIVKNAESILCNQVWNRRNLHHP